MFPHKQLPWQMFVPSRNIEQTAMDPSVRHQQTLESSPVLREPSLATIATSRRDEDEWRPLAWVTSICVLFLIIGLLGLRARPLAEPAPTQRVQIVPVVFTPPELPKKLQPAVVDTTTPQPTPVAPTTPVVAATEPAQVAFPVPVQSPVVIVTPQFAPPPAIQIRAPAAVATEFNTDSAAHGYFQKPKYPASELAAHHDGRVMLSIVVSKDGKPQSVAIKESSGWPKLDSAAAEKARKDWDFGPGPIRYFYVPVVFQIK
ncbi:MAG: tonB [Verrucomicrobiales bacterium]|nr:tonB [Verrucomicrobiales bacterium]